MHGAAFECCDPYRNFECRSWRIRRTKCARQKRNIRIVLQGFKLFRRDRRNKEVRVVSRPRGQRENVAVVRIDNHNCAAFGFCFQGLLREFLEVKIERGDNIVTGHRRRNQFLGSFPAIFVEREFVLAVLAREHFVERLFEPFASFGFGPERFVIINDAIRVASSFSSVTDDLPGQFPIGICADINRPHHHSGWQIVFDLFVLSLAEILPDLQWHNPTVAIMP